MENVPADATVRLLEPTEPYAPGPSAPDADDFVTAEDAASAAADADAVAAGIVSRMSRPRPAMPDVFASHDDRPADAPAVLTEVPATTADRGGAATDTEETAPDRRALLRLFSALKEN